MRKRRALIFDDETVVLEMLKTFLSRRGYEVFSSSEPIVCPDYKNNNWRCSNDKPCTDIMITDYLMPGMTGLEMLKRQQEKGCGLDIRNKAIISGFYEDGDEENICQSGYVFFRKPFRLAVLSEWIDACEQRMPLSTPLSIPRKERRETVLINITYSLPSEQRKFSGSVTDLSDSGFCLRTDYDLSDTEHILLDAELPISCKTASVCWTRKLDGQQSFAAGINCC